MAFLVDVQELKSGLIIFRRGDVQHRRWYCRIKLPKSDRYKTVSLRTSDIDAAKERAFDEDADVRLKHEVPVFNRPFSQIAKAWLALQKERAEAGQITPRRYSIVDTVIRSALNPYVGTVQINLVGHDRWTDYPLWRKKNGRSWMKRARTSRGKWYRAVAYNVVLIMCNTGMRPAEAKNLRWREVSIKTDSQGRRFVILQVRGKDKFRGLVAASTVADYLERVRDIAKATEPDDFVFRSLEGKQLSKLYAETLESLLTESRLLHSASGARRSTYCFRHTYATFRLMEGVDIYFLAKQMGTSVQMIENHYGHINPVKNAERILQGLPGWEPMTALKTEAVEQAA